MTSSTSNFTESTLTYWQSTLPSDDADVQAVRALPYKFRYPALLPDGSIILLPIRPLLGNSGHAVASLLVNQASFNVVEQLSTLLSGMLKSALAEALAEIDVIIGLPSLGNTLAPLIAKDLGFSRYVPLGYSRKFWYEQSLSTAASSITSPGVNEKRIYLDPHLLPLIRNKKVIIVDDAISTGTTINAVWDLLECAGIGADIKAVGVVMKQGHRWREILGETRAEQVTGVFDSPLLEACQGGWQIRR